MFIQVDGDRDGDDLRSGNGIVTLIPYVEVDGARTVPDSEIEGVYTRMQRDGLTSKVFAQNEIMSATDLLAMLKSPSNLPVFLYVGTCAAGFAWLNSIGKNYAYAHFVFLAESWGKNAENKRVTDEMGHALLRYWFSFEGDNGPIFDTLVGVVPSKNVLANRFVQRMGLTKVGEIPHIADGGAATINYIAREDYG